MQDVETRTEDHARASPRGRRWAFTAIAAALGAAVAGAYAYLVGCDGTCPLTSSVWTASLYGSAVGALVGWPGRREAA
ncbi:MAG TPA: DUF6132 family protein [Anaeromyxobacter sp.]|nr:DUF6132 family protein [Anaeromyxobacter sp.]